MKGFKKCSGLLLALFIMLGLSLSVSYGDSKALKHEYQGIFLGSEFLPSTLNQDSSTGLYSFDYNAPVSSYTDLIYAPAPFILEFKGDSYDSDLSQVFYLRESASFLEPRLTYLGSDGCSIYSDTLSPLFSFNNGTNSFSVRNKYDMPGSFVFYNSNIPNFNSSFENFNPNCTRLAPYGSSLMAQFNSGSLPIGSLICGRDNGAVCSGVWDSKNYIRSKVLPYYYSFDGFYLKNTAIDTDSGAHYNYSFTFSSLFNVDYISKFSYLEIPLKTNDDYFNTSSNLFGGREIEFKGAFEFDGNFSWHDNISSNGSYFRIALNGLVGPDITRDYYTQYFDCYTNMLDVPFANYRHLEYSCSGSLDRDYIYLRPSLQISGNDNYVWLTDDDWRWAGFYLVTDNDETPSYAFNTGLSGGGTIIGSDEYILDRYVPNDGNWFNSLTNLFGFNFMNPFAPIFNLFTDQSSCAKIPTLAGMLHSETDEVCPWFDSNIRGIVTPVLSLASMMLVFGFVVRWLGSSSGNLFEDSTNETISNVNHSGFRRYKK